MQIRIYNKTPPAFAYNVRFRYAGNFTGYFLVAHNGFAVTVITVSNISYKVGNVCPVGLPVM